MPGSRTDLARLAAVGADVRTVCSPIDALPIARQSPDREVARMYVGGGNVNGLTGWVRETSDACAWRSRAAGCDRTHPPEPERVLVS